MSGWRTRTVEGLKKEKRKHINLAYKDIRRSAACDCFAEGVDLNLGGRGGRGGGGHGAGDSLRYIQRKAKDNRGKDGDNNIKHWLINEESRDVPARLPRLPLMSINSVICISDLLLSRNASLLLHF